MSVFLELPREQWVAENELCFAIRDGFPVSPGHTLIITKRVVETWFHASKDEQIAMLSLLDEVKHNLDNDYAPDGYNVGFNAGSSAGQTVSHLHVHVIPRFRGDVDDPRGGIRFVIPQRGNYRKPGQYPTSLHDNVQWIEGSPPQAGARVQALNIGGKEDRLLAQIRPLFSLATEIDIVAAFVQRSGVDLLAHSIETALERGVRFRVITGDYLHITQEHALRQLLDWAHMVHGFESDGSFEVRIVENKQIHRAFHPKAWIFRGPSLQTGWVGSSNWSHSALNKGIEWNLRVEGRLDPVAFLEVTNAFDTLWKEASKLTETWISMYAQQVKREPFLPLGEAEDQEEQEVFEPRPPQIEALKALEQSREEGHKRALCILATGLGKTFLAAFDVRLFIEKIGRMPKVLFVAHRREILMQAALTFRKVFPKATLGHFYGANSQLDAEITFASIQKLHNHREQLQTMSFDYVIFDEVHHATSATYRAVSACLQPSFLLGLTATPERSDQADVIGLFDDHIPIQVDLAEGIDRGLLAPFRYVGLADTIEYEPFPWRTYSAEKLAELASTEARMEKLWEAWKEHPGTKTLVFCVSIIHADYVCSWLQEKGIRAVACHTGSNSAERDSSIEALDAGALDTIVSVDLFNEGVDVPSIDRVVMLRPTNSPVLFLQQLGRGLRKSPDKDFLQVIDFIGNHRAFLHRVRQLLNLSRKPPSLPKFIKERTRLELPEGCNIELELEVINVLERMLPKGSKNETIRVYRELREIRAEEEDAVRPSPGELVRLGLNPGSLRKTYLSWFGFVRDEGDLNEAELQAFALMKDWLRSLETSSMTKSFKMVALDALLEHDVLFDGMPLSKLAWVSHDILLRNPALFRDLDDVKAIPEPKTPEPKAWLQYWRKNPIQAWCSGKRTWFEIKDEHFVFKLPSPENPEVRQACEEMTRQIVDWRLAMYRRRRQPKHHSGEVVFTCKVSHSNNKPILFLPSGPRELYPEGLVDVRLEDGSVWQFRFVKIAVNVAGPLGQKGNQLPDLLRRWFGPNAGKPGTEQRVRFRHSPEGWWVEPAGEVIEFSKLGSLPSFPTLRAAAGAVEQPSTILDADEVSLPIQVEPEFFAVRVSGNSMNGGTQPIQDGDWAVLQWARGKSAASLEKKVVLAGQGSLETERSFYLKRARKTSEGWALCSDNPDYPEVAITEQTEIFAKVVKIIPPEQLAPPNGQVVSNKEWMEQFGFSSQPSPPFSRIDGHLVVFVDGPQQLVAPDRVVNFVPDVKPGETAYIFTQEKDERWRYAGVGRLQDEEWSIPDVDFKTWKHFGEGRSASRRLPPEWKNKAKEFLQPFATQVGSWIEARGKRCRVVGMTSRGGLSIDGGEEGFATRSVSITDIAWVLWARQETSEKGGILDEERVNRLRYLDGTPKASTRWIDTGWALVLTEPK